MELDKEFFSQLEQALEQKQNWFNKERLPELLNHYRLFYTCVKNLNDMLTKKSLIIPDPYKLDKRISEIVVPDTSPFSEGEIPSILGSRLSEFETMLDFLCTYFRFSVENFTVDVIKKLLEMNRVFDWTNVSMNNGKANTRSLAIVLNQARVNMPAVVISTMTDSLEKCSSVTTQINKTLNELAVFQKELLKGRIRKDIIEHPDFDDKKASVSAEEEFNEIKRMFAKIYGKKTFYVDLVNEIVKEDQAPNKAEIRGKLFNMLGIPEKVVKQEKKGPEAKELLIQTVIALNGFSPILSQLLDKLSNNFNLLFIEKKTFFGKLISKIKKSLGLRQRERICNVPVIDQKNGTKTIKKVNVNEFLIDLDKKSRIYGSLGINGSELEKLRNASEDSVLIFLNKQISENQQIFVTINALDDYFKANVDVFLRAKVKGMKIDLSSYKNIIVAVNKKRGEYVAVREENEQMKKLGILNNEA